MILSLRDRLFEKLDSPALVPYTFCGVDCFIRQWTERERIAWGVYVQGATDEAGKPKDDLFLCQAVQRGLVDESGELIFEMADVEILADLSSVEIQRAFNAIVDLQKVDDAKKN